MNFLKVRVAFRGAGRNFDLGDVLSPSDYQSFPSENLRALIACRHLDHCPDPVPVVVATAHLTKPTRGGKDLK